MTSFLVPLDEIRLVANHWSAFSARDERLALGNAMLTLIDGRRHWVSGSGHTFSVITGDEGGPSEPVLVPGRLLSFLARSTLDVSMTVSGGGESVQIVGAASFGSLSLTPHVSPDRRSVQVLDHEPEIAAVVDADVADLVWSIGNTTDVGHPVDDDAILPFLEIQVGDNVMGMSLDRQSLGSDHFEIPVETTGAASVWARPPSLHHAISAFSGPIRMEFGSDPHGAIRIRQDDVSVLTWPNPLPDDQLLGYVEDRIAETFGVFALARDGDGDYIIRRHGIAIFARLFNSEPTVLQVFAVVLDQVEETPGLLHEINELNVGLTLARVMLVEGQVLAEVDLVAHTLDNDELRAAAVRITQIADGMAPALAVVFGGRVVDPQTERLAHYRTAVIDVELHPNRTARLVGPDAMDAWGLPGEVYIITASDPSGVPLPAADNRERNEMLATELYRRGCSSVRALGSSPDGLHQEDSFMAWDLDRQQAADLGREFGQDAIFAITEDTVHLVPCIGEISDSWPRLQTGTEFGD